MNEKHPNSNAYNKYRMGTNSRENETGSSEYEHEFRRAASDTLLRAANHAIEYSDDGVRDRMIAVALGPVQLTHHFDLTSDTDRLALARRAEYVGDQLLELAASSDDLTTSDLQGTVDALALRLVRNQLPVSQETEGGDHE